MANKIKTYTMGTVERMRLEVFCVFVNTVVSDFRLTVEDIYFDYGQNWLYSGIVYKSAKSEYQAFCPRDWELILETDSILKLYEMATYYAEMQVKGEWSYKKSLYEIFE